jgi:hypothetical protein
MNNAETDIINSAEIGGGELAAISRIGAGEVRVDRAFESPIAAWDADMPTAALSFGFHDVADELLTMQKTVVVHNYTDTRLTYAISHSFRFADDEALGAVSLRHPSTVRIAPNSSATFNVTMHIHGANLPEWVMNSGANGANPDALTFNEIDGYLWLDNVATGDDDENPAHLPWHVLPRQASRVVTSGVDPTRLANHGVGEAVVESYSLIGISEDLPEGGMGEQNPTPDFRYLGYTTIGVPAGFCGPAESFLLAFAANTWEPQSHGSIPTSFWINLDVDQDPSTGGGPFGSEYTILTRDASLNSLTDGRNLTFVVDWSTGAASAFFFTDHETNSGNTVMYICSDQIGMTAADLGDPMDVTAEATDFYFGGDGDIISGITIAPGGEKYIGVFDNGDVGFTIIPPGGRDVLRVIHTGSDTNNTETGLLLLYRSGNVPEEAEAIILGP